MRQTRLGALFVMIVVVCCAASPIVDDTCTSSSVRLQQNSSQAHFPPRPWAVLLWVTCVGASRQAGASAGGEGTVVRNCAGALVKDSWIVTTAECVSCSRGEQVSVTADIGALSNDIRRDQLAGNKVQRLSVDKVVFHPKYTPGQPRSNVALLHLSVRVGEATKFVIHLTNCSNNVWLSQLTAQSSEWVPASGELSRGTDLLVLRSTSVSLWSNETCRRALGVYYPELLCSAGLDDSRYQLPANGSLVDYFLRVEQCSLRKGSPLVVLGKPAALRSGNTTCDWQLTGLLYMSAECNGTGPSLFVNLCRYGAWLENTIQAENTRFEVYSACPSLPLAPVNGYLCSSNVGDIRSGGIQFCCKDGFRLVGSALYPVCNLARKGWEPEVPPLCEPVQCLPLPSPEHGSTQPLSCSNSSYLSSCLFTCDDGYHLTGSPVLTCGMNGIWNNLPPKCNAINCGPPLQAVSLKVQYSNTDFGASAIYQCSECFRSVSGNVTMVKRCEASGEWTGSFPLCEAIQCVPIVAPLNGGISQTSSLCGSSVRFYCDEGYALVGMEETVCLKSGEWSNPVPICRSISCAAPIVEGSNFNFSTHRFPYGRTVQVECNHCRRLEGGDGWLTCDTNGYWNKPLPRCNWIACSPPPFVPNLLMNPPGSLYFCDTTVQFSCNYGYRLEGTSTITCQNNGTWSNAFPTCKAITCPSFLLSNGVVYTEPGPISISRFSCDPCFKLNGPRVIKCTQSGTWNDTIPKCDLILCNPLKPFAHGHATPGLSENRCLTSVMFQCQKGYTLNGPTTITCGSNGIWDQLQPTCQAAVCPLPPQAKNNSFICTAIPPVPQFEVAVKYCCVDGYQLIGGDSGYVVCTEEGKWSGPAPECQAITCLEPTAPANGALTFENSVGGVVTTSGTANIWYRGYGSQVTFKCNVGYVLIGEAVLTCGQGGSWNHNPPICRLSQCNYGCQPPPIPTNGRLANIIYPNTQLPLPNSTYIIGTVVVFVCEAGFHLAGSASRTCKENGLWSDQVTRCYPFDQPRSKFLYKLADMPWQSNEQVYVSATDRIILACQTQLKETGVVQSLSKLSGPTLDRNVRVVQSGSSDSSLQLSLQPLTALAGLTMAGIYKCQVRSTADGSIVLVELLRVKVYSTLCPVPMTPGNGSLLTAGTYPGSCTLYTCNEGHTLVGMETSICYENGTWSNKQPLCVPTADVQCDPPILDTSVFVSPPPSAGGRYRVGDTVVYRCSSPAYRLVGASSAVCTSGSIWSTVPPTCVGMR